MSEIFQESKVATMTIVKCEREKMEGTGFRGALLAKESRLWFFQWSCMDVRVGL